MGWIHGWVLCGVTLVACAGGGTGRALRSPSLDYAPPAPTTADGDTVGADRRAPADKVNEGATTAGPAPGWEAGKAGLTFDPKRRTGGAIEPAPANGSSGK